MAVIYVARSKSLSDWGATVGISKNLFKVGIAAASAKEGVAALNEAGFAGATDWALVASAECATGDEADHEGGRAEGRESERGRRLPPS